MKLEMWLDKAKWNASTNIELWLSKKNSEFAKHEKAHEHYKELQKQEKRKRDEELKWQR